MYRHYTFLHINIRFTKLDRGFTLASSSRKASAAPLFVSDGFSAIRSISPIFQAFRNHRHMKAVRYMKPTNLYIFVISMSPTSGAKHGLTVEHRDSCPYVQ